MMRPIEDGDIPALQAAIDKDTFHPGEWRVTDFRPETDTPAIEAGVVEDSHGTVAFIRFTKTLRISCIWDDAGNTSRNARAIVRAVNEAVQMARGSGFSEIIIHTTHPQLADFLERVLKMTRRGSEFLLAV